MKSNMTDHRLVWLSIGMLAGLAIASLWPHEPAHATTTDRSKNFAMVTCPLSIASSAEAIFVIDYLTGRLQGRVLNPQFGKFTHTYFRDLYGDFQLDVNGKEPQFAFVSAQANLPSVGRTTMAAGAIYVGEMTTGQVIAYGFPFNTSNRPVPPAQMIPLDKFQFREPSGVE